MFILIIGIYFGGHVLDLMAFSIIKYGKWSDICDVMMYMDDVKHSIDRFEKKLSIKVAGVTPSLVGRVIFGRKLYDHKVSRNSLNFGFSLIFNKSILYSPDSITSHFLLLNSCNIGCSSRINVS